MYEVIPAILEKEWIEIEKKLELIKPFAKTVHIDFIDGKFANNTTFLDPKPFSKYKDDFILEAHLMVDDPLSYLKPLSGTGFKRFLGHIEKMPDQVEFVAAGQLLGEVGLALDGKTSLDKIKVPYDDLDCILLMMIDAGFSGQKFKSEYLEKIKQARVKTMIPIEVDGGMKDWSISEAKKAGANLFAVNSSIFKTKDPKGSFNALQTLLTT